MNKKDIVLNKNKTKKNIILKNVEIPEIMEGRLNKPQTPPPLKKIKNKTIKIKPPKKIRILEENETQI